MALPPMWLLRLSSIGLELVALFLARLYESTIYPSGCVANVLDIKIGLLNLWMDLDTLPDASY